MRERVEFRLVAEARFLPAGFLYLFLQPRNPFFKPRRLPDLGLLGLDFHRRICRLVHLSDRAEIVVGQLPPEGDFRLGDGRKPRFRSVQG